MVEKSVSPSYSPILARIPEPKVVPSEMADDIAGVLPAHRVGAFVAEAAPEAVLRGRGQERAVGLALLAGEVPAALVLGHLAHQRVDGEAGGKDLADGGDDVGRDALALQLGDGRRERHGPRGGPPRLPHPAEEALGDISRVEARSASSMCASLAADRVWQWQ